MQGLSEVANFVKWRDLERWPCRASCQYLADLWQISRPSEAVLRESCCRLPVMLSRSFSHLFHLWSSHLCLKRPLLCLTSSFCSDFLSGLWPTPSHFRGSPFGAVSEAWRPRHGACLCTPVVWSYTTNSSCINALYSHYMEVLIHLGVFEVALAV